MFLPSEDRAGIRFGVHVDCLVVRDRDFRIIGRGSLDLSITGMLVPCTYAAEIGDEVIVSFKTPRRGEYVDAVAIVTRILEGRRRGDLGMAAGLTFISMDDASRAALGRALIGAPTIMPRARRLDYAREVMRISAE